MTSGMRSFLCTVCGNGFETEAELKIFENIPYYLPDPESKHAWIKGKGTYTIFMCKKCLENLGEPIEIVHKLYDTKKGVFEKSEFGIEMKLLI